MTDYKKLVKELRGCKDMDYCTDCPRMANGYVEFCNIKEDAADAIEALQAEVKDAFNEGYNAGYTAGIGYCSFKREKQPHWVSVAERLPKETKLVVTYGKSRVSFGYNLLLYDADTDKEVVEWFDYCGNRENVTHWMPLPKPPQEVQDGQA